MKGDHFYFTIQLGITELGTDNQIETKIGTIIIQTTLDRIDQFTGQFQNTEELIKYLHQSWERTTKYSINLTSCDIYLLHKDATVKQIVEYDLKFKDSISPLGLNHDLNYCQMCGQVSEETITEIKSDDYMKKAPPNKDDDNFESWLNNRKSYTYQRYLSDIIEKSENADLMKLKLSGQLHTMDQINRLRGAKPMTYEEFIGSEKEHIRTAPKEEIDEYINAKKQETESSIR